MMRGARPDGTQRFPRWPMFAVLAAAALVRFHHLGTRSVWTDEGSAWTGARLPLGDLIRRCIERDASPPLFYLLTSVPLRFADDAAHLRLVSVLASLALVWVAYRLARLVAPRGPATLAAAIVAVAPFQVMYAQEARTYVLVALFAMLALHAFARAALHGRPGQWIVYVVASAAGLYTQSIAVLAWPAQVALLLASRRARAAWRPWIVAQVVIGALYAPWAIASAAMASHLGSSHWYIPSPGGHGLMQVLRTVLLSPVPLVGPVVGGATRGLDALMPRPLAWILLIVMIAVPLIASLDGLMRRDARRPATALLWGAWTLPLLGVLVLSFRSPLLLARYFVFAGVPVAVLMALGIAALPTRAVRAAWGGAILAVMLFGLWRYDRDYTKERWAEVAADIAARATDAAPMVLVPFDRDPLEFYADDVKPHLTVVEYSHPSEPFAARYTPAQQDDMAAAAARLVGERPEVWVVVRSANNDSRQQAVSRALQVAGSGRMLADDRTWTSTAGPLRVLHYVAAPRDSTADGISAGSAVPAPGRPATPRTSR